MARIEDILKCFQSSNYNLYGREKESESIVSFLKSKNQLLHITGNPGTGKTHTVLWTLNNLIESIKTLNTDKETIIKRNSNNNSIENASIDFFKDDSSNSKSKNVDEIEYLYLNYFTEGSKLYNKVKEFIDKFNGEKEINQKKSIKIKQKSINICENQNKIVVIDEFDKYYDEKKKECLKTIYFIKNNGFKLITISNNLRMGNIKFLPYTSTEMITILKNKMANEIECSAVDNVALAYLIKKYGSSGDLRSVIKKLLECILRLNNSKDANSNDIFVRLPDVIDSQNKDFVKSIHHEIIHKIKENEYCEKKAFKKYLKECDVLHLIALERADFNIVYDLL